jgi:glycosyltransferase involved in cell wall biosynthesis
MKVGTLHSGASSLLIDSLRHVIRNTEAVLSARYEVVRRPDHYWNSSPSERRQLNEIFCQDCEVLLGPFDPLLIEHRATLNKPVPYICLLFGAPCRGFSELRTHWHHLTTSDILVGNCVGDLALTNKFFQAADVVLLPFPFDNSVFFPQDSESRIRDKLSLGFQRQDRLVLYAGRLTLEKNLQTVLKIFSALERSNPNLHLLVAGESYNTPFFEFGVYPVDLMRFLKKTACDLCIAPSRLHFLGQQSPREMRSLYSASDVLLNMTLHHDENFGLAQVEAIACGTPVVGTSWGGLNDTIVEGKTGYKVSTYVTGSGVRVDWLAAVWRGIGILNRPTSQIDVDEQWKYINQYSAPAYAKALETIVERAIAKRDSQKRSVGLTAFGREFWDACGQDLGSANSAPYLRSVRSRELYRELVAPYAGHSPGASRLNDPLTADEVLCAGAAITDLGDATFEVHDPLFCMTVQCPASLYEGVNATLKLIRSAPWTSVEDIGPLPGPGLRSDILQWMIDAGLLIRTCCSRAELLKLAIPRHGDNAMADVRLVRWSTDLILLR